VAEPKDTAAAGGEQEERFLCASCASWQPGSGFPLSKQGKLSRRCKKCLSKRSCAYYHANKLTALAKNRAFNREARLETIHAYGGHCSCCGETHWEFLTLDHINGGGKRHQKLAGGRMGIYRQLKAQNWPKDTFRLLCYNCNCARSHYEDGICPHHRSGDCSLETDVAPGKTSSLKRCPRCGVSKTKALDFFRRRSGASSYCKPCTIAHRRELRRFKKQGLILPDPEEGLGILRYCPQCELWQVKTDGFHRNRCTRTSADGLQTICKSCARSQRLLRIKEVRIAERKRNARLRREILAAYGGQCACCGEMEAGFLTVDHVNGNGSRERRTPGLKGSLYGRIKRAGFPRDKYRLLCYNCNCSLGTLGYCPHKRLK
jgi:hypothetical protein